MPDEVVFRRPDILWKGRDGDATVLDHQYHRVDAGIVRNTVERDLVAVDEP